MQSILAISPTKIPTSEVKNDRTDTESIGDADKMNSNKKEVLPFSSILNSLTEKELKTESNKLVDVFLEEPNSEATDLVADGSKTEVTDEDTSEESFDGEESEIKNEKTLLSINIDNSKKESNHSAIQSADEEAEIVKKDMNIDVVISAAESTDTTKKELSNKDELSNKEAVEVQNEEAKSQFSVADKEVIGVIKESNIKAQSSETEEVAKASLNDVILLDEDITEGVKKETDSDQLVEEEVTELSQEELATTPQTLNPILAQIEIAQKTDTKVNELKNAEQATISLKASIGESKDKTSAFEKVVKLTPENVLSDEPQLKEGDGSANKLNNIASSAVLETDKPVFNLNQESNSLRSVAMTSASSEKLLNQTTQNTPLMQSAALQQPIEVQSKQASAVMGERIMMMINQGKQEVTIRLDPAELGSMNIKLQVQQDQLHVSIQTQIGQSRDIIEQNLPRLRDQLAQQGINLAEASVEQQSQQNQSQSQHSSTGGIASQASGHDSEQLLDDQSEWISTQIPIQAQGIDYYA